MTSSANMRSLHYVPTKNLDGIIVPVATDKIISLCEKAEGKIPYPLTNDRVFRGIFSYSEKVRKGLAAVLLDRNSDEIDTAEIMNPICFGSDPADDKETEEDIKLLVNGTTILDIEMQNLDLESNNKRFLTYLCRNFNTLERGKDYNVVRPSLLVGITNYTLDHERPEFYAQYRIQNKKTGKPLFADDHFFGFNILDLNSSSLADSSDRKSGRVLLAGLCRASTWEELRALSKGSEFAEEVMKIMYMVNADQREQWRLEAARRKDELQATIEGELERKDQEINTQKTRAEKAETRADKAEARANEIEKENEALREQVRKLLEDRK